MCISYSQIIFDMNMGFTGNRFGSAESYWARGESEACKVEMPYSVTIAPSITLREMMETYGSDVWNYAFS